MAGISKNQMKSSGKSGQNDMQVKYSDPRMAYMSTKKELVVKESDNLKMKDIFGEDVLDRNSPVVVCEDHLGYYITSKAMIDVPLLDVHRMYTRKEYDITKEDDVFKINMNGKTYAI